MPILQYRFAVMTAIMLLPVAARAESAPVFNTLVTFDESNGSAPYYVTLVQGTDGNLYGTTVFGGTYDEGTIFRVTTAGALTTIHSFSGPDGEYPFAGLVLGKNGDFYGTTVNGGSSGFGTVFQVTAGGTLSTLHSFAVEDGANPFGGLVQASDGVLYGTTNRGGANTSLGTVFEIAPNGTFTTLHNFGSTDGAYPYATLIQATNQVLYGSTANGGSNNAGVVFAITPGGDFTTIDSFDGTDGATPFGALLQAANGALYGTTPAGGYNSAGTLFEVGSTGTLTTLYTFSVNGVNNGSAPYGGLVQATDQNFYGMTYGGGDLGDGTIFAFTPGGKLITLHRFEGTDGAYPYGGLLQATDGNFYGTTYAGGSGKNGTVFSLSLGLPPFIKAVPAAARVGEIVTILGTDLRGTTGVSFNGTAAAFSILSPTLITATVPAGATSGIVQATSTGGTLSSNVAFRVLP
jgi:uncharacterized repeat protein (TIGR03803 family)